MEIRNYDPELAEELDYKLNYCDPDDAAPCQKCGHTMVHLYERTGYVLDDGQGVFVEKKCLRCGDISGDGDGDFHDYFKIVNGEVLRRNEED